MKAQYNSRFAQHVSALLDQNRYVDLFTSGCCYHFALRLHLDRQLPVMEACRDSEGSLAHVWLLTKDRRVLDISGVWSRTGFTKKQLQLAAGGGPYEPEIQTVDIEVVRNRIDQKPLRGELSKRVDSLALSLFDSEPRFASVRLNQTGLLGRRY